MTIPPRPVSPRRRGLLAVAAALVWMGLAQAAPPAVNLSLEWRLVPWPPAPMPLTTPGTVTVGTTAAAGTPPGTRSTRTAPAPEASPQRLVLRNGGQAQITLSRDDLGAGPDWVWTAQGGQGLQGAMRRHGRRESLWVRVQWPGGRAPAQIALRFEQPLPDRADGERGDAAQQFDAELLVPFDQWVEFGRWTTPDRTGQAFEARLTRLP